MIRAATRERKRERPLREEAKRVKKGRGWKIYKEIERYP